MEITSHDFKSSNTDSTNPLGLVAYHKALLLLGKEMAQNGLKFPLYVGLRNVWYVFTDSDHYITVESKADAEKMVSDLQANAATGQCLIPLKRVEPPV